MAGTNATERHIQELRARLGVDAVVSGEETREYTIDGLIPDLVVRPGSAAEVADTLSYANQHARSVIPWGGGTQQSLGNSPKRVDLVLSLERMHALVAHEPADMTVTVEAGMPLAHLQELLAESGQFLPIDPPHSESTTIGGILATRAFGPLRLRFRTISDWLLGVKVVTADGQVTNAGGRVVKNVSGYELGRLYTGSLGTLAVIVEATFKVYPLPRNREGIVVNCATLASASQVIDRITSANVQPAFMELVGPFEKPEGFVADLAKGALPTWAPSGSGAILVAGFMGTSEETQWQRETALAAFHAHGVDSVTASTASWETVYTFAMSAHRSPESKANMEAHATCRAHVPQSELITYISDASRVAHDSGTPMRYAAHAGSGVVRLHLSSRSGDENGLSSVRRAIDELRAKAEVVSGHLIVERAPAPIKNDLDAWGSPGDDFFLHQAVKDRMDPTGILNPGRFIGGI